MGGANALYEGHRLILPGIRDRARATCQECRYCVPIVGREETRLACLATLDIYLTGVKRVPGELKAVDFIWLAGREKLVEAVNKIHAGRQACGLFCPNI
ncbi:hypothetical protein [Moorella sulfitireducens (nom. illeg.)]|uniref:hypothetical protein n=1 Tax=Neomoorella sulfitireducens TaxID=2972948 RepID=UPI0021AC1C5F|nr:hypothetical protein [Moorella sulfitireducens]